jgi:hypothetical protein
MADICEHESHADSFFDFKGVEHHKFLHQGQTVNCWYYLKLLKCLGENVQRKRTSVVEKQLLHHNSAPANASLLIVISVWEIRKPAKARSGE